MREIIRKSFLLGLGAASITKTKAQKMVKELVKRNAVSVKEGKDMLKKIKKHTDNERKRVHRFAKQEAKRVAGKIGVVSKNQLNRVKKRLKSIDKDLSNKGKKTLKNILKELSK